MKNNIIEIPFTSFVAYMLLDKREINFFDVSNCISRYIVNCKDEIIVIEDDDCSLYNYIYISDDKDAKFIVNKKVDYEKTIVNGFSFKEYLQGLSSCIDATYLNEKKDDIVINDSVKSKRLFLGKGKK